MLSCLAFSLFTLPPRTSVGVVRAEAPSDKREVADPKAKVEQLEGQVKSLQELVPDQAAVMSHLAYHFTNLWFAASEDGTGRWPTST